MFDDMSEIESNNETTLQPIFKFPAVQVPHYFSRSQEITLYCYHNHIPLFLEAEMDRLYGNIFSSMKRLHIACGDNLNTSAYLVEKGDALIAAFLFRQCEGEVEVLNEVINIAAEEISRFSMFIFTSFRSVNVIKFHAIETRIQSIPFPYQQVNYSENIVVPLPSSEKQYWSSLGKSMRHNIKYYRNKLNRDFPPFSYDVYEKGEINDHQFKEIIKLSKARIEGKGKTHDLNMNELEGLIKLAKVCGLMGVLTIGGKVCAGAICHRVGDNYFLEVIAHDPAYNDYRLGTLCCYLTICAAIARGGKEYHFLWGQYDYKYRFLGVQRDLGDVLVYRSRAQVLINGGLAIRTAFQGCVRSAKLWLNEEQRKDTLISRIATKSIKRLKSFSIRKYFVMTAVTIHDGLSFTMDMLDAPLRQFI